MTSVRPRTLLQQYTQQISRSYDSGEADAICRLLLQECLQVDRAKLMINDEMKVDASQLLLLDQAVARLSRNEPIQHVIGHAYFYDRPFKVSPEVLIPRQETEELVGLIQSEWTIGAQTLLDIGTGSGCIPITLALDLPNIDVYAVDISEASLDIARENADSLGARVAFSQLDILIEALPGSYDVIVSNPPYITEAEKEAMHENVLAFEPSLALFVPNNDPLKFYRRITDLARSHLKSGGKLYFEINEHFGPETLALLDEAGFINTALIHDLNGKHRIVKGQLG
mgnify:CR=1 FL=1